MRFSSQVDGELVICVSSSYGPRQTKWISKPIQNTNTLYMGLGLKCNHRRSHVGRVKLWSITRPENPPQKNQKKSTTRTFLASSKPTKSNYRQPSHGTGESPESARFSGHESGREIPGARCVEAARREGRGMWWEWEEDGEEAARPGEEVPVDFDFISLLCKPKVGIATPTPRLVSSPSISPPRSFFFSVARLFMT